MWTGGQLELTATADSKVRLSVLSGQMEWDVPSTGELILMITEPDLLLIWVDRRVRPSSFTSFARRFVYNSDSSGSCPILFWKRKLTTRAAATASRPLETDTDGHISRITFKAHWVTDNWRRQRHDRSIGRNGQKVWEFCLGAMETAGYLSSWIIFVRWTCWRPAAKPPSSRIRLYWSRLKCSTAILTIGCSKGTTTSEQSVNLYGTAVCRSLALGKRRPSSYAYDFR